MAYARNHRIPTAVGALLLLALSACTEVRLISDYDTYTDEAVSKLQQDVELFLTTIERTAAPACNYEQHGEFYTQATADINVLMVRNELRPKNSITNQQLKLLAENLKLLEDFDKQAFEANSNAGACISGDNITVMRSTFGSQFGAILKLEMAKRRGGSDEEDS